LTKLEIIITIHKDVVTKPVLPINPPSPRPRYLLHLHKAKPIPGGAKHHNGHHFSARLNPPLASYKKSWKDCNNTSIAFHPPRVLTSVVAPIIPPKTNTSIVLYCTVLYSVVGVAYLYPASQPKTRFQTHSRRTRVLVTLEVGVTHS
jgi:hypothetical protein